jgi:hypothetical protein
MLNRSEIFRCGRAARYAVCDGKAWSRPAPLVADPALFQEVRRSFQRSPGKGTVERGARYMKPFTPWESGGSSRTTPPMPF